MSEFPCWLCFIANELNLYFSWWFKEPVSITERHLWWIFLTQVTMADGLSLALHGSFRTRLALWWVYGSVAYESLLLELTLIYVLLFTVKLWSFLSEKLNHLSFVLYLPPTPTAPLLNHMTLENSPFGNPAFSHEFRIVLCCIFKQGLNHKMVTLRENFIWLWLCKRLTEI